MTNQQEINNVKRAKNIAAVLYLLVLGFIVGGSYFNQQGQPAGTIPQEQSISPAPLSPK